MELLYTADAVALAEERFVTVLGLLRGSPGVAAAGVKGSNAVPRTAELYRQALIVAELEQLANEPEMAETTYANVNEAVPMDVAGDDLVAIRGMRRRYEMLGKPLRKLEPIVSLDVVKRLPMLPATNAITALLLFPDWCAQCVRMAQHMPESVFQVTGHEAYMNGLLAQTMAAAKLPQTAVTKDGGQPEKFNAAYAAEYLRGTPTLTVAAALLDTFDSTEVPLLIVVDSHGIVRLIEGVDEDALQPGKTVDSAIALVGRQWPSVVKRTAAKTQ